MATAQTEAPKPELPDPEELARTYAEVAQRASRLLGEHLQREARCGIEPPKDEFGVAQAFLDMTHKLLSDPFRLAQAQMNLAWDYYTLWQHTMQRAWGLSPDPVAVPEKSDKRFKHEDWQESFLFDFIKQSYLIAARNIHDTVCCVEGLDDETQKKVNFYTRQYIDAISPSNFALTNPEVFQETLRTQGQNLIRGFNNLLRDVEAGNGQLRIRMTDTSAFELGKNVATTPGKVVFQNDMMQLLHYTPTTEKAFARPLLIVPPWINKYYILDLREKNSYIKWAVDQGHSVFVISWVNPDSRHAEKGFDDYLSEGIFTALDAVIEQTGAKEVNAAGYCLGGTLLACALAWMAVKRDKRIASATFFTTLLDFSQPGELGVFIDEQQVQALEKRMAERGYLEGSEMAGTFNMLRANDLIWSFVVNNYLMGKDPFPFDLLYWNSDSTRLPAKMHSFYLRRMYMENALSTPGSIELCGVKIDLSKIKIPCYFISTLEDHIAPWKTTYLGARLLGRTPRFVLGGSGHIAGIVNPPAANKYGFWVHEDGELPEEAEAWQAGAQQHAGSWWTDWQHWVTALDSKQVPAIDPADDKLGVLEDAPGGYVKARLDKSAR
ncbi:MAG: class I poly(R)-hydroxyalkanoic acid synthase [Candidatus Dactylopiibacterium carminicum]|uniref:Class I poly(R)-hydroxyalkanoic acid synthase n=1 Tax=Candidatus Dactylopiibacterium carminicum TaxID=857335 RepID=A0A272EW33_9RHOO|nr:class I poly(R)-hydroxyalkanoic acid synthase [Candidatus Dactylopiibacterium carminicum]KAF7599491.1 class I poly(R)-hydroxyalkanoic acid synthase [Candidatus Dactylopiibacterium carminicum]PAS94315.1 MAG: class I poly(R)-hydroxyalkanoic acid synthase [Candidatus Dactylopiibacterium carminicum]PAS99500.1 MAG: class I poly(R)-hydroxyalkanoic acid synthase [Candidatus Dactylopiibacterium carminicum]